MEVLSKNELLETNGGGFKILLGIVTLVIFVVGIIDGYFRPYRCRS